MWLETIDLQNFKSYEKAHFSFPAPLDGRNITLIGGANGHGKTTLLEAIYLCFYGEDSSHHLARAGLSEKSYAAFIKNALHGTGSSSRAAQMSICVRFAVVADYSFEVKRVWFFKSNGTYDGTEAFLTEIKDGVPKRMQIEKLSNILYEHVVPAHLAPFFFFDGEAVKNLIESDRRGMIKRGMESLLGVVHLREVANRLEQYQANRRSSGTSTDRAALDRQLASIQADEAALRDAKERFQSVVIERDQENNKRAELQNRLMSLGAGDRNSATVADILIEESEQRRALEDASAKLASALGDELARSMFPADLTTSLKARLVGEATLAEWQARRTQLEPDRERFSDRLISVEPFAAMPADKLLTVIEAVQAAWEGLFWPQPEGCASSVELDFLSASQRERLANDLGEHSVSAATLRELLQLRTSAAENIRRLTSRRIQLQAVTDDGTLKAANEDLRDTQVRVDALNKAFGGLEREIESLERKVQNERAAYEKENKRFLELEPQQSSARKASKVIDLVGELLPALFALKTKSLAKAVTKRFHELAERRWIEDIEITQAGEVRIFSADHRSLTLDLSAGEQQVFATALIAGLGDLSGYSIPLVIDTPLSRLASAHVDRVLRFWRADPDRQIIVLSQDREITPTIAQQLEPFIAKKYLLDTQQQPGGYYRTTPIADTYFE